MKNERGAAQIVVVLVVALLVVWFALMFVSPETANKIDARIPGDKAPLPTHPRPGGAVPTVVPKVTPSPAPVAPDAVSVEAPVGVAPDSGRHILGGECFVPYARSDQDSDLICSVDCGMTWRSISHPGVCY